MKPSSRTSIAAITKYTFQDEALLELALTHSSCDRPTGDNQRLEFLGDAVLDLIVAEKLFRNFPQADEGALDRCRASIVNGKSLARAATIHGLSEHLLVSKAHKQHHPEPSHAMLEDALEALIGAIYLDGGINAAQKVIDHIFGEQIDSITLNISEQNPKGSLQEWAQKYYDGVVPFYKELPPEGPDHARRYKAIVFLGEQELGQGSGSSKKTAETEAAVAALKQLSANK